MNVYTLSTGEILPVPPHHRRGDWIEGRGEHGEDVWRSNSAQVVMFGDVVFAESAA